MEQNLDPLHQASGPDPNDAFSVEFTRAREQLWAYYLPDHHMFVLRVLQSAVAAGATIFSLQTRQGSVHITHDGVSPRHEQLGELLSFLLPTTQDDDIVHLRPLASAVNAALSAEGTQVCVTSWDGAKGSRLIATRRHARLERISVDEPMHDSHFVVQQKPCVMFDLTQPSSIWGLFGLAPEGVMLKEAARYAPLHVYVNGSRVSLPNFGATQDGTLPPVPAPQHVQCLPSNLYFGLQHHAIEAHFAVDPWTVRGIGLPPESLATTQCHGLWPDKTPLSPGPLPVQDVGAIAFRRAVLAFCVDVSAPAEVALVSGGVLIGRIDPEGLPQGLVGAVAVDAYPHDLTGLTLIDSAMRDVALDVRRNANRLLTYLCEYWSGARLCDRLAHLLTGRPGETMAVNWQ